MRPFLLPVVVASALASVVLGQVIGRTIAATPAQRIEAAKHAYRSSMQRERVRLVTAIQTKLVTVTKDRSLTQRARLLQGVALAADVDRCRKSQTNVPMAKQLLSSTIAYEEAARDARRRCRREVKAASEQLSSNGKPADGAAALRDLESYCPRSIGVSSFANRMRGCVEAMRSATKKHSGKKNGTADARDELADLVRQADKRQISAEDLTRRARALIPKIEGSKAFRVGANRDHHRCMKGAAEALGSLLERAG